MWNPKTRVKEGAKSKVLVYSNTAILNMGEEFSISVDSNPDSIYDLTIRPYITKNDNPTCEVYIRGKELSIIHNVSSIEYLDDTLIFYSDRHAEITRLYIPYRLVTMQNMIISDISSSSVRARNIILVDIFIRNMIASVPYLTKKENQPQPHLWTPQKNKIEKFAPYCRNETMNFMFFSDDHLPILLSHEDAEMIEQQVDFSNTALSSIARFDDRQLLIFDDDEDVHSRDFYIGTITDADPNIVRMCCTSLLEPMIIDASDMSLAGVLKGIVAGARSPVLIIKPDYDHRDEVKSDTETVHGIGIRKMTLIYHKRGDATITIMNIDTSELRIPGVLEHQLRGTFAQTANPFTTLSATYAKKFASLYSNIKVTPNPTSHHKVSLDGFLTCGNYAEHLDTLSVFILLPDGAEKAWAQVRMFNLIGNIECYDENQFEAVPVHFFGTGVPKPEPEDIAAKTAEE